MSMQYTTFENQEVKKIYESYPAEVGRKMYELRELILTTAKELHKVTEVHETIKWGEPSFITMNPKTGTTIRVDWKPKHPTYYAIYVNCKTNLIESFRLLYPNSFSYEGSRAIHLPLDEDVLKDNLKRSQIIHFIQEALTYHLK